MIFFVEKIQKHISDRKITPFVLAFSWLSGVASGILIVRSASEYFVPFVRSAAYGTVSVSGLLASVFLPFLFSELAIIYRRSFIWLICFIKAFSLGACISSIALAYGSGAWLMYGLLLFSENLSTPILYAYWLLALDSRFDRRRLWSIIHAIYLVVVVFLDVYMISPILSEVIR